MCFEVVTSPKINLGMSELVTVGGLEEIGSLVQVSGCKVGSLPMNYLGMPLGAFKARGVWHCLLERMEKRLASWKRIYLSKGGRSTLIKSTLSSLLAYFLSLFPILKWGGSVYGEIAMVFFCWTGRSVAGMCI